MTDAAASSGIVAPKSSKRTKRLTTALLCLFLVYTFFPLFYLVVAATKSNDDLFSTFGLWFGLALLLWRGIGFSLPSVFRTERG